MGKLPTCVGFFNYREVLFFWGSVIFRRQKVAVAFEVARHCRDMFTEVPSLRRRVFVEGKRTEEEEGIEKGCSCNQVGFLGALTVGWYGGLNSRGKKWRIGLIAKIDRRF